MTDTVAPTGAEAQPSAVANSIDNIVDQAIAESVKTEQKPENNETADEAKPELSPAEELEKLRRAKTRDDKRIGKLTAQKYQFQKEADELRSRLSTTAAPSAGGELSVAKTGIPTKLDQNKFNNYADYIEARAEEIADYKIDKKLSGFKDEQKANQQTANEQAWESQRITHVDKQAEDFAKDHPDVTAMFEEYSETISEFPKELKHALLAADNAPLAFYNLAKDGKLEDLAQMSLVDAKVEIRLAQLKQPEKPKTKAPIPLPTSRGSVASGKRLEDMDGKGIREWLRSDS